MQFYVSVKRRAVAADIVTVGDSKPFKVQVEQAAGSIQAGAQLQTL